MYVHVGVRVGVDVHGDMNVDVYHDAAMYVIVYVHDDVNVGTNMHGHLCICGC